MVRYPKNWDILRKKVLKRDHFTCQICEVRNISLQVHHKEPLSKGGSNALSNLVTLCKKCHEAQHPHMTFDKIIRGILLFGIISLVVGTFVFSVNIGASLNLLLLGIVLISIVFFLKTLQIKYYSTRKKYRRIFKRRRR